MARYFDEWHKIPDGIFQYLVSDDLTFKLMATLCRMAAKEDKTKGRLKLKKGQLVTSDRDLAAELGLSSHTNITRKLKLLSDENFIFVERTKYVGTLITVCCIADKESGTVLVHSVQNSGTQNGTRSDLTKQEVKPRGETDIGTDSVQFVFEKRVSSLDIDKIKKEEEGAAGKTLSQDLNLKKEDREQNRKPPEASDIDLIDAQALANSWEGYCREYAPSLLIIASQIMEQFSYLSTKGWDLKKLKNIFAYISRRSARSKVSIEWISPMDAEKLLFGRSYIEWAHLEATAKASEEKSPQDKDRAAEELRRKQRENGEKARNDPKLLAEIAKSKVRLKLAE